ncbi:Meiotically up-regulated protein 151 protein [Sphaceloma murrayae]|uniref:Meiotically up-regulated protein 151 protein n=1 Tax=Sphaceloma murrayae TaxID=2082308 RepID=A0A2K1QRW4_9PEZI|nr:Meiotically up-regulated protein 151 protein [Sphaceloma murrayae]
MSALGLGDYTSSDDEADAAPTAPEVQHMSRLETKEPGCLLTVLHAQTKPITDKIDIAQHTAPPESASNPAPQLPESKNIGPLLEPAPGPAPPPQPLQEPSPDPNPPLSPYTLQRQRIHDLTLPPHPNISIPPPPPPPSPGSMAKTNQRIRHFLDLKKQGVHFNERLLSSPALRDAGTVERAFAFAGLDGAAQYDNALPEGTGVDVERWVGVRVEDVVRRMEGRRNEESKARLGKKRDFVGVGREGG